MATSEPQTSESVQTVRISQLVCPQRHCIMAIAYEHPDTSVFAAKDALFELVSELRINQWCGVCGSTLLVVHDEATKYSTLAAAAPHLQEIQRANLEARAHFERSRPSTS